MNLLDRIEAVRDKIERACLRSGRKAEEVRLMGVSKFHGREKVEEALRAGLDLFGENRVREAAEKFETLKGSGGFELHLIGILQRNKAKLAAGLFDCIESLDRDELIVTLGGLCSGREDPLKVLLEFHTGEESKSGYPDEDALSKAAELVLSYPGLKLCGLMTMAPFTKDEGPIRRSFRALAAARERLAARFPEADLFCLSMGMSNDFETAIEEGSTLIRVGSAIFGERL